MPKGGPAGKPKQVANRKSVKWPLPGPLPPNTMRGHLPACILLAAINTYFPDLVAQKTGDVLYNRFVGESQPRVTSNAWRGLVSYQFGPRFYPAAPMEDELYTLYEKVCGVLNRHALPRERLGLLVTAYVGKGGGLRKNDGLSFHKDDEPMMDRSHQVVMVTVAAEGHNQSSRQLTLQTDTTNHHVELASGTAFCADLCNITHGVKFGAKNAGQRWYTFTWRVLKTPQ